ncbi:hypothetical protein D3C81_1405040 [compost metagenome]
MTLQQFIEGPQQRSPVEGAEQAHGHGYMVGAAGRRQLPGEPHALLGVGKLGTPGLAGPRRDRKHREVDGLPAQTVKEHPALFKGQPDKAAGEFHGVFWVHRRFSVTWAWSWARWSPMNGSWSAKISGCHPQGPQAARLNCRGGNSSYRHTHPPEGGPRDALHPGQHPAQAGHSSAPRQTPQLPDVRCAVEAADRTQPFADPPGVRRPGRCRNDHLGAGPARQAAVSRTRRLTAQPEQRSALEDRTQRLAARPAPANAHLYHPHLAPRSAGGGYRLRAAWRQRPRVGLGHPRAGG